MDQKRLAEKNTKKRKKRRVNDRLFAVVMALTVFISTSVTSNALIMPSLGQTVSASCELGEDFGKDAGELGTADTEELVTADTEKGIPVEAEGNAAAAGASVFGADEKAEGASVSRADGISKEAETAEGAAEAANDATEAAKVETESAEEVTMSSDLNNPEEGDKDNSDAADADDAGEAQSTAKLVDSALQAVIYTDSSCQEMSDDQTIITVKGQLPEKASVNAYPVNVDQKEFDKDIAVLRAYDITILNSEGGIFEPDAGNPISVKIEIPGLEDLVAPDTVSVYYVPEKGEPEEMKAEAKKDEVSFDAEHFSTYAVTAAAGDNKVIINGETYTLLANYTETVNVVGNNDKIIMKDTGTFNYKLDFTLDNTKTTDRYYIKLPQYAVLKEVENEPIKDSSGKILAHYTVNNDNETSYILITPAEASTQMSGEINASGSVTKEGKITFNQGAVLQVVPPGTNYNNLNMSKTVSSRQENADGSYTVTFKITIKNTGTEDVNNIWFLDEGTKAFGSIKVDYTLPASADPEAPAFISAKEWAHYTGSDFEKNAAKYDYYMIGDPEHPVTIPAGKTYTYQSSVTVSAADYAKVKSATTSSSSSNAIKVLYGETLLKTTSAWINYYPTSLILEKKALAGDVTSDSKCIPWEIAYNESGKFNVTKTVISDTIRENAYQAEGIHYLTDEQYPAYVELVNSGKTQTTIQLTWVEVDDLNNIQNPDAEHIYYKGNSFRYFPYLYSGWKTNFGTRLYYYTTYNKNLSATSNEAQADFVDQEGHPAGVGTAGKFDARVQLNKMLVSQNDDNTATWKITISVNSTSDMTAKLMDTLPGSKPLFDTLVNIQKIAANIQPDVIKQNNNEDHYVVRFESVEEFEEVTGIQVNVTDRVTGAELDKNKILCGDETTYSGDGIQAGTKKYIVLDYCPPTLAGKLWIHMNVDAESFKLADGRYLYPSDSNKPTGFLPSNSKAGTSEGYNITFTYSADTSNAKIGETRINQANLKGKILDTKDSYDLNARAQYIKSGDGSMKSIDKNLARVELQGDGSYLLTYMMLLDNRGTKSTQINKLYWDDVLSGVKGADYVAGSLDVYKAKLTANSTSKTFDLETYSSLEELEAASAAGSIEKLINHENHIGKYSAGESCDLTELMTVSDSAVDDGFRFTLNLHKLLTMANYDKTKQYNLMWNSQKIGGTTVTCWSSYYLVYDVKIPASKVHAGVLNNSVTRYVDGTADVRGHNEFALDMKELQKTEIQRATSDNDYTAKYELDVTLSEELQALNSFTIQDVMSDNLHMDINSMVITSTDENGVTSPVNNYTSRFANGSLTLVLDKPNKGWPLKYTITYDAKVSGDGPTSYQNSAWIPEIGSSKQTTESNTYITESTIGDKQVKVSIQKYDGNDLAGGGLDGASFALERLTNEAQKTLIAQNITSRMEMEEYLSSLPASSWLTTGVPQPKATGTKGEFSLESSADEAVYSNVVYRLKEKTPPEGYVMGDVHRYFMIYSETADETETGVTASQAYAYLYQYVDEESYSVSYQIPNYKVNFNVYKTDRKGKDLTGAEFTLYSDMNCTNTVQKAIPTVDKSGRTCYNFKDLNSGIYYVKETKAPEDYKMGKEIVKVTVSSDGKTITFSGAGSSTLVKETDDGFSLKDVDVYLSKEGNVIFVDTLNAFRLPDTGGKGTLPLTVAGLLLAVAPAVLLRQRKKKVKKGTM